MTFFGQSTRAATLFFLLVLFTQMSFSQAVSGSISGRVTDATGASVPGASVQMQNTATGFSRTEQTDSAGRYAAGELPLGPYTITIQHAGFRTEARQGITLTVASELAINITLVVGDVSEKVQVTAEAPQIETTNATISGLVAQDQIRDLPLNGRSLDQLALFNPGVLQVVASAKGSNTGMGMHMSINGGREEDNLFLIDGTVVNDHTGHGPGSAAGQNLGVEAILEFRVMTHNFSAEYGRSSGAVISAVTRSGTNDLHGSLYEFVRNNQFDAKNFFTIGALPHFERNQFGGAVGGRIIKDKLFYFGNFEALRERQGNTVISVVPDLNARNGILPASQGQVTVNPVALKYVDLYPLPTPGAPNFGDGTAENVSAFSHKATENYSMERVDYRISDKDNFYGRYIHDASNTLDPVAATVPTFGAISTDTNNFAVLSETHVFSPTALNEFRAGFQRTDPTYNSSALVPIPASLSFVPGQAFGTITPNSQLAGLGPDVASPQNFAQNIFQENDTFSKVKGAHSLKFGVDVERVQLNVQDSKFDRGNFVTNDLATLLAGQFTAFNVTLIGGQSSDRFGYRRNEIGWFVSDEYRIRPNLTLTLGIRQDILTNPTEINGRIGSLINVTDPQETNGPAFTTSYLKFSPRVGLAWDPTGSGKTAVRAGGGVFYSPIDGRTFYAHADKDATFYQSYVVTNNIPFPLGESNGLPATLQATRTTQYNMGTPTIIHWNVEVQRQLAPSLILKVAYVGSDGWSMPISEDVDLRTPQILANGTELFSKSTPLINTNFSRIQQLVTRGVYNYNGLQTVLQKNLSFGLRFQASYTFSKMMSTADEVLGQQQNGVAPGVLNINDIGNEYSLGGYNQTHSFVTNSSYLLPGNGLHNRMAKAVLGGWELNGIFTYGSGLPMDVLDGFNNSQNGDLGNPDRPSLVAGANQNPVNGTSVGCTGVAAGQQLHTPNLYFDPCSFILSPPGTFGNLGRNVLTGPGLVNLDSTLVKNMKFSDRMSLQFRAEFFNITNHANFDQPGLKLFSSSGKRSGSAGVITDTATPDSNREIQLGMKLIF